MTNRAHYYVVYDGEWKIQCEQTDSAERAQAHNAMEGTLHLARLWAHDEILRLKKSKDVPQAVVQAGAYQLVTPVSGAVVLETQQQFALNGLTPAELATLPSVPEPTTVALVLLGAGALLLSRRRSG